MEPNIALAVGEALFPKLSAFHQINGRPLRSVRQVEDQGSLARIVLDFGPLLLVVDATEDDDSIDFKCEEAVASKATDVDGQSDFWQQFIGQPFGWGWVTVNQQGYCDGLLLSFGGVQPQVLINVIASSLKLRRIAD